MGGRRIPGTGSANIVSTDLLDKYELVALARLDLEKERFDQALVRLKQAASLDGEELPDISALLGATYARLRLWDRAQAALSAFLTLRPDALNERFQLGMTYFDSGDHARALEVWQQVLGRAKLHPPALYYSALANARLGRLQPALEYCQTVLSTAAQDNLFHGRAKELLEQLRADPKAGAAAVEEPRPAPRKSH